MWLFTKYGFYSVVSARQFPSEFRLGNPIDPNRMMVRSRLREHLDNLKDRFPGWIAETEIHEFAGTDYPYRLFLAKSEWVTIAAALATEIRYDNFKEEAGNEESSDGSSEYLDALHEVWRVMRDMELRVEYRHKTDARKKKFPARPGPSSKFVARKPRKR